MKIIHLGPSVLPIPHPLGGAIQRRIVEIAKTQAAAGHHVIIYSADERPQRKEEGGIEIRSLACRYRSAYLRDIEYLNQACRSLKNEAVDVMHFHGLPEGAALSKAVPCRKVLSYDYFVFRKGKKNPLFRWYRKALQSFFCLLPVSEFCRGASHAYWKFGGTAIRVLHNGVNPQQFFPDDELGSSKKKALNLADGPIILYVGRVCEQKGTDLLVDAYVGLRKRGCRAHLVIAGPAGEFGRESQSDLTRRISQSGGLYLGAVAEAELASVFNLADIFVMPTREIEMFGMAAVEAQACGKPVVASRHGGLPEVISENSGRFFPVGDSGALAEQLGLLLGNPELRMSLGKAARENALRFAWTRIAAELDSIYGAG